MRKIRNILTIGIILALSGMAMAEGGTCKDGVEVTGQNGHVYCQSKKVFSWYAAMAWCYAQDKRHLVTIYEACNSDPSQGIPSFCANLAYTGLAGSVYTSSNKNASQVYYIYRNSEGATAQTSISRTPAPNRYMNALCW